MIIFTLVGILVVFCIVAALTEVERFGAATVTMLLGLLAVQYLGIFNLFDYVHSHVLATGLYVLAYVVVGVAWSFVKWFSFLMQTRDELRTKKEAFYKNAGLVIGSTIPEDLKKDWVYREFSVNVIPQASRNKSRITFWMSLWPFSLVGTLLNDPIRRLFTYLFNVFKSLYQRMANKVFEKEME